MFVADGRTTEPYPSLTVNWPLEETSDGKKRSDLCWSFSFFVGLLNSRETTHWVMDWSNVTSLELDAIYTYLCLTALFPGSYYKPCPAGPPRSVAGLAQPKIWKHYRHPTPQKRKSSSVLVLQVYYVVSTLHLGTVGFIKSVSGVERETCRVGVQRTYGFVYKPSLDES